MATGIQVSLNLSATPFNPLQHGCLELHLRRSYQCLRRSIDGTATLIHDGRTEELWGEFHLPLTVLAQPELREQYILRVLSSFGLDPIACDYAAPRMSVFAVTLAGIYGTLGFNMIAEMDVSTEAVVDDEGDDALLERLLSGMGLDDDDVVSTTTRGASRLAIGRLRKESCGRGKAGDDSDCDACVICLEEFSEGAESTRLPCAHLFHHGCIVRWLEDRDSCPICRHIV